jgi:photosystem II stability/assembly factor-like uncharacterized protein
MQNNQFQLSFRWFYKRFTYLLHLFTTKKLPDNWRRISLLYYFTKSFTIMKIICNLAFLWYIPIISGLLFPFLSSCNQAVKLPQSSSITDSVQTQKRNKTPDATVILKSVDGGQTWQNMSEGLPEPVKEDYGASRNGSFSDDNGLWLTAGKGLYHSKPNATAPFWAKENLPDKQSRIAPGKAGIYAYNYNGGGIFQKANETSVWSPVFKNFQEKRVFSVFETAGGTVFIGSYRGFFKSSNSGKSWKKLPVEGGGKMVESNGVLLATSEAGIVRSTDNGENWALVISEGGVGIDVASINGGFAAITYSTVSKTRRIRASYDGGKTWQAIDAGLQVPGFIEPILPPVNANRPAHGFFDSTRHPVDTTVLQEPTYITTIIQVGENFFCGRSDGIYRSSDKGKTWQCVRCVEEGKMFILSVSGNVIYAIQTESHC